MRDYKINTSKGQIGKTKISAPYNAVYIKKRKIIEGCGYNPEEKRLVSSFKKYVEKVFEYAVDKVGIEKRVDVYSIEHSYSAHLLENETVLGDVRELLRQKNSKTIEMHNHNSNKFIGKVINPRYKLVMGEDDE